MNCFKTVEVSFPQAETSINFEIAVKDLCTFLVLC